MQSETLSALGKTWIDTWNSRDLETILALYGEDAGMASAGIVKLGFSPSGTLQGKDQLRAYWSKVLSLYPNLHFDLIDTFVSPDSVVVRYTNDRGMRVCEYLRVNAQGKIIQG